MKPNPSLAIPSDWKKVKAKVTSLIKKAHLIIEVVDARIITSTSDVLDYSQPELQSIPRIIYLSFEDLAKTSVTNQWRNYFATQKVFVIPRNFFKKGCITDLWSLLISTGIIDSSKSDKQKTYTVALTGAAKTGKRRLITLLNCKPEVVVPSSDGLYSKIIRKSCQYNIAQNLIVIDTIPVIPNKILTNPDSAFYLHLFGKFKLLEADPIVIATKALQILLKVNPLVLNKYYGLHITPSQTVKPLSADQISDYFEKIAVNRDLVNEFNNIESLQACNLICKEFSQNIFHNLSLELPPKG